MPSHRRLPVRILWGANFANTLWLPQGLDQATSYPRLRPGAAFLQTVDGREDAHTRGTDWLLQGLVRRIPREGSLVDGLALSTGWDGPTGFRAFLEWARARKPVRVILDDRNLLGQANLALDANANGVADGWTAVANTGVTGAWAIEDAAQRIDLTGGTATTNAYAWRDDYVVAPGERVVLSVDVRVTQGVGIFRGGIVASVLSAGGATLTSGSTYPATPATATGWGYRVALALAAAPATAVRVRFYLTANAGAVGTTGSAWFRNPAVTRASSATPTPAYVAPGAYREAYLVEEDGAEPSLEGDDSRQFALRFRSLDRLPWEGF